ncbi:CRISPR-associated helicase Cas3' [Fenollaria sporofastidiosus]|uniref:CRISPR-associated helicase Cas3' n=1 Tax=Fenollaria sporofastidiosus TaxID=2811778 RepID=UPI001C00279A|nr:CRISPR-associated helicase Cas3' [Fenollaria sporofastidiosus]
MKYAHIDNAEGKIKKQELITHLKNTADKAKSLASEIDFENTLYLVGILHDIGKASEAFQHKIINNTDERVNHSSAGALYLLSLYSKCAKQSSFELNIIQEYFYIMAYVISAHHGIYDIPYYDIDNNLSNRLKDRLRFDEDEICFKNEVLPYIEEIEQKLNVDLLEIFKRGYFEYKNSKDKIKYIDDKANYYYLSLYMRLFLSILKNADIVDTINAYDLVIDDRVMYNAQEKAEVYKARLDEKYASFPEPKNNLDKVKNDLKSIVDSRSRTDNNGIYKLDLATGAGKTLLSMLYATNQMKFKDKKRFFYITAFLSVLEQNASEVKDVLKDKSILEYHSNIVNKSSFDNTKNESADESKENMCKEYLFESFDAPVVLTTLVQFINTLFKGKSTNIRRFSSLINSVIILDEVQSLPIEMTYLFNLAMNFISSVMKTNIVLSTATQPKYDEDNIKYRLNYAKNANLVRLSQNQLKVFKRTKVYNFNDGKKSSLVDIKTEVLSHAEDSNLIILNTKRAARNLYKMLLEDFGNNNNIYLLNTDFCPEHRKDILNEIKAKLSEGVAVKLVSTQLIEAGVNVDFKRLIRSYAGIDSLIQAIGRCNRYGLLKEGIVKLVNMGFEENLNYLESIQYKKDITEIILNKKTGEIDIDKLNDEFFARYYTKYESLMAYPLEKDKPSAFDLLSDNINNIGTKTKDFPILRQSFKTAADNINLIKNDTKAMIVCYRNSITGKSNEGKYDELKMLLENEDTIIYNISKIKRLLKEMQSYTINIYENNKLNDFVDSYMDGDILLLKKQYYNDNGFNIDQEKNKELMPFIIM